MVSPSPTRGICSLPGSACELRSPRDARALGIGMVFQNFTLIPALSVPGKHCPLPAGPSRRCLHKAGIARRIRSMAERFGLSVEPSAPFGQLSVGDQQKVEILKLLLADARVLILDEPTKVLAPHEVAELFRVFEILKAEGYAILFITHKLREVMACADRITVMRQGRVAGSLRRAGRRADPLWPDVRRADRQASRQGRRGNRGGTAAAPRRNAPRASRRLHPRVSEQDRAQGHRPVIGEGEIVGVAGVPGNGQKELGDLILGVRRRALTGRKLIRGERCIRLDHRAVCGKAGWHSCRKTPWDMAAGAGHVGAGKPRSGNGQRYWGARRSTGSAWRPT